jgi:manganese-dependent ADP-ribose/CDP-alcohol diphosphatase
MIFKFGILADVQYEDRADYGACRYRQSLTKLLGAVEELNRQDLAFVAQLGDLINGDEKSYSKVLPLLSKLKHSVYPLIGNHDLCIADSLKADVYKNLGMPQRYYSQIIKNWRLLFLDGNDLSLNAYPEGSEKHQASIVYYDNLTGESERWNGGIDGTQLQWLENELNASEKNAQSVLIFCHFPLTPESRFTLWNRQEVLALVNRFQCVKAWLNGHHHEGGYHLEGEKHYITFKGMVETAENSFATVAVYEDKLEISGFGREDSRVLNF